MTKRKAGRKGKKKATKPKKDYVIISNSNYGKAWKGTKIYFEGKNRNINDFLLMKRGFHWINEHPYYR